MDQVFHVAQPRICGACLASAHSIAAMSPPDHRVLKICACGGADACVIAVAAMVEGSIRHWHIEGPMDLVQAHVVADSIVEQFRKAGMAVHSPRTQ